MKEAETTSYISQLLILKGHALLSKGHALTLIISLSLALSCGIAMQFAGNLRCYDARVALLLRKSRTYSMGYTNMT